MPENDRTLHAENALAGAILVDSRCMERIPPDLQERDFLSEPCRNVYSGARALEAQGKTPDPVLILKWAAEHGKHLKDSTVLELMELTPTAEGAGDYAGIVHENALRRRTMETVSQTLANQNMALPELLSRTIEGLQRIEAEMDNQLLISASSVPFEPPRWLIEPYIQRGKGTLIQADPGTGKTAFVCALAAAVSTGRGFLNLQVQAPGDVVMLSMEDDLGVLRGRIEADGGDLDRIHFVGDAARLHLNSPKIRQAIRACHAKMVIFDPFQAFLGAKVDLFRANETRPVLAKLFDMCAREDCACVIVAHLGKVTQGKSAVNQSLGSVDIPGAMRSIIHITRNPNNPEERLALHIKSSNAPRGKTIAYNIGEYGRVNFTGFSDLTMEDIASWKQETEVETEPLTEVLVSLMEEKGEGFYGHSELREAARKKLGYVPYPTPQAFRRRVEEPDFVKKLQEQYGIRLTTGQRQGGVRGIRLVHWQEPEGWQLRVDVPNVPNVPPKTVQGKRHTEIKYGTYCPADEELYRDA